MNRERAETFLRLLVEAELRGAALPALSAPPSPGAPFVSRSAALTRAAWALTAVGALDPDTTEDIMFDAELALATRHRPGVSQAGVSGAPDDVGAGSASRAGSRSSASASSRRKVSARSRFMP